MVSKTSEMEVIYILAVCSLCAVGKYKVRPGTIDFGKEYELKAAALLSLRCVHSDVSDMWMASNADGVGAFDDIVLQVQTRQNETVTYMLQLKHQDQPRNVLEKEFLLPKGDFALSKYFKDIDKLFVSINSQTEKKSIVNSLGEFNSIYFVLFTNRGVYRYNFFEKCDDCNVSFLKTDEEGNNSYRLDTKQLPDYYNVNTDMHYNLHLFSNQVNAKHIDKEIEKELFKIACVLDLYLLNPTEVSEKFVKFITDWAKGNLGGHYALTRQDILWKLFELLIHPYEVDLTQQCFTDSGRLEETAWNKIVSRHIITLVDANNEVYSFLLDYIKKEVEKYCVSPVKNWNDALSIYAQNRFYEEHVALKANMLKMVGNNGRITFLDVYKCLWTNGKCPLLLEINDQGSYQHITSALKQLNPGCKIIVINKANEDLPICYNGTETFRSLKDLNEEDQAEVLQQLVNLQGRSPAKLEDLLDENMLEYVKCCDVISILSNNFNIGSTLKPLPSYFVPRSAKKTFLKVEVLEMVEDEIFLLNDYSEESYKLPVEENAVCLVEGADVNTLGDSRLIVVHKNSVLKQIEPFQFKKRIVHHASIYNEDYLEWKWSSGSTNNISPFRVYLEGEFEGHFGRYFSNPVNIICEIPGMGKSVLIDYLALQAPASKWVLRVNLNEHQKYYRQEDCKQATTEATKHLHYFYNALLKERQSNNLSSMVFQKLLTSMDVIVFLDGYDEVSTVYKAEVTNIVKSIHREGYHVWITTRPHLKYYLEKQFGTLAICLNPFNVDDQEQFLRAYFTWRHSHLISDDNSRATMTHFVTKLLQAAKKNLFDKDTQFTGVPLQTELLADFFNTKLANFLINSNNVNFNESFDLLNLYQNFIDRKFDILCDKFGDGMADAHIMCRDHQSLFALKLVFPMDDHNEMKIFQDLHNYYQDDARKIELLQRDGVIVVDEQQNVSCTHRTFAEFLAATWLAKNLNNDHDQIRGLTYSLIKQRFTDGYQFLFSIFDRLLAKDCPLHLAAMSAGKITSVHSCSRMQTDKGGRSVLHVVALYDHQFPLAFDQFRVRALRESNVPEYIDQLIDDLYPAIGVDVIGYSPLDYALSNRCLLIAAKLCEKSQDVGIKVNIDLKFKGDYLKYCIELKYKALFKVLLQYFTFRSLLLKQVDGDISIKQYLHDSIHYPHNYMSHSHVLDFIKEFKDVALRKYIKKYSNYKNDFRFALSTGQNSSRFFPQSTEVHQQDVDNNTFLHYAVLHGRLKYAKMLLEIDATTDVQNNDGDTPLHLAFLEYNWSIIELLLSNGVDINISNKQGDTVLHLAVQTSDEGFFPRLMFNSAPISIMKLLFAHNADINAGNNEGETPLHIAALKGCGITAAELLLNGADINKRNKYGYTPLHLAVKNNYINTAELFLLQGADVHLENAKGETILHTAAENGCFSIVMKSLSKGVDVNKQNHLGDTPLLLASKECHKNIVNLLLHSDANINQANAKGATALHFATTKERLDLAATLLSQGIDANRQDNAGDTPLHLAINREVYLTDMDLVKLLLSYGVDVNAANINGQTCLHHAARNGNIKVVSELLSKGTQINRQDRQGNTPLHLALRTQKMGKIKVRSSNDENVNLLWTERSSIGNQSLTACKKILSRFLKQQDPYNSNAQLYLASMKGHIETAKLLIDNGADVNIENGKGKTALYYAAENFYNDIVIALLAKGADINKQDEHGDTALHLAYKKGHTSTVELLISRGADETIENLKGITADKYSNYKSLKNTFLLKSPAFQNQGQRSSAKIKRYKTQ